MKLKKKCESGSYLESLILVMSINKEDLVL